MLPPSTAEVTAVKERAVAYVHADITVGGEVLLFVGEPGSAWQVMRCETGGIKPGVR